MGRPPRITRDQILAAARAVFAERGFDSTTLADIARPLGVTAAAILRHFRSKQDLFAAAMTASEFPLPAPLMEVALAEGLEDPRAILRRFAEQFVPFIQSVIGPAIAVQMHVRSRQTTVVVPFDVAAEDTPPRRGLKVLTAYFDRAMKAGMIRPADPRAMALLFAGHLQSYVLMHDVLDVKPVYPLDRYLDALFGLWLHGAITGVADAEEDHPRGRGARRRSGSAAVLPAKKERAGGARIVRDGGSADGAGGVAGRRPRRPRSRR
jgi:AcrR family transcriptional regulator